MKSKFVTEMIVGWTDEAWQDGRTRYPKATGRLLSPLQFLFFPELPFSPISLPTCSTAKPLARQNTRCTAAIGGGHAIAPWRLIYCVALAATPHAAPLRATAIMGDAIVGIIGMGDMGKMYARRISDAGWK